LATKTFTWLAGRVDGVVAAVLSVLPPAAVVFVATEVTAPPPAEVVGGDEDPDPLSNPLRRIKTPTKTATAMSRMPRPAAPPADLANDPSDAA
jgi:hypothetical protein